jgi:hypothetical protein
MASGSEFLMDIRARMTGPAVSQLQAAESAAQAAIDRYSELERTSAQAAKALERIGAVQTALKGKMAKAMEAGDGAQFWKLAGALRAAQDEEARLKSKAAETSAALAAQGKAVGGLADQVGELKAAEANAGAPLDVEKTAGGLKKLGGPLGAAGDKAEEFSEAWGALRGQLGTSGAVLAVAGTAFVAFAAAIVAGVVAIGKWTLGMANANRTARLTAEGFALSVGGSDALTQSMRDVEKSTGIGVDRQRDLVRSLKDAGVSMSDIPAALKAIATQEAAVGDSSGTQELVDRLKEGKTNASALAKEMEGKFGGIVKAKMKGLDEQAATFKRNLGETFGGLSIEGFLDGLSKLVSLFDANTESGKALKTIFEAVFQPLFNNAHRVFTAVERLFLGFIEGAIDVAIAVKKFAKRWDLSFPGLEGFPDIAEAGKFAAYALAGVLGVVAAIGYAIYASFTAAAAGAQFLWDMFMAAGDVGATVVEALGSAASAASEAVGEFIQVGADIVSGIAQGITDNAAEIIGALTGVMGQGVLAARNSIESKSPSKLFARVVGAPIAQGVAMGIDQEADGVTASIESMVAPPDVAGPRGGGGRSLPPMNVTINVYGDADESTGAKFQFLLVSALEDAAEMLGAAAGGPVVVSG